MGSGTFCRTGYEISYVKVGQVVVLNIVVSCHLVATRLIIEIVNKTDFLNKCNKNPIDGGYMSIFNLNIIVAVLESSL